MRGFDGGGEANELSGNGDDVKKEVQQDQRLVVQLAHHQVLLCYTISVKVRVSSEAEHLKVLIEIISVFHCS